MQLKDVTQPFGEVDIFRQPDNKIFVKATILMRPSMEGAYTGLAIDGSNSMTKHFAAHLPPLFRQEKDNIVQPIARMMVAHLASFSANGSTSVIYWACGAGGKEIEVVGDVSEQKAASFAFAGPKRFGTGTRLLPPVRYFTEEKFRDVPWNMCVFITDGIIEDLAEVKTYSIEIAKKIAAGKRSPLKFVLIGVGSEVDEKQMAELDDLDASAGLEVDIWDHKLAAHMKSLDEVFAEVVSETTIVAPSASVLDSVGRPVVVTDERMKPTGKGFSDGLPGKFYFLLPAGSTAFTVRLPEGMEITQNLE